ncbi:MAG: hypothetical protein AAF558_15760 [Verrucomicrobiota bacterium]
MTVKLWYLLKLLQAYYFSLHPSTIANLMDFLLSLIRSFPGMVTITKILKKLWEQQPTAMILLAATALISLMVIIVLPKDEIDRKAFEATQELRIDFLTSRAMIMRNDSTLDRVYQELEHLKSEVGDSIHEVAELKSQSAVSKPILVKIERLLHQANASLAALAPQKQKGANNSFEELQLKCSETLEDWARRLEKLE